MVHYIMGVFLFATSQMFAGAEDDISSCLELFKPENIEQNCCEISEMLDKEHFESCKTDGGWECENARCVLEKSGMLTGDAIDDKKTKELLEKFKEKSPQSTAMVDRVRAECLDGKYEDYPPKEACPLIRFQICSYVNALVECEKWKQTDSCKGFPEHAKSCKTVLDKLKE